jgi:hypothetical protein
MNNKFDELTKRRAQPVTRRAALKIGEIEGVRTN